MEIKTFQEKLKILLEKGRQNHNIITVQELEMILEGTDLDEKQIAGLAAYLNTQSIKLVGTNGESQANLVKKTKQKPRALTDEEKTYLREYLNDLPEAVEENKTTELLFALNKGDLEAYRVLASGYLRKTAEITAGMIRSNIFLADLIQEANISMLQALDQAKKVPRDEEWLLREIRNGIRNAEAEQERMNSEDDSLVARVERLEEAVRELSDNEDAKNNAFDVNELAILLDMDEDEIRRTLQLTGEEG